jgi:hypothetical protein
MSFFSGKNPNVHHSLREISAAAIAGIFLFVMAIAAIGAYGVIHGKLVIPGNGPATAANIMAGKGLFSLEIALWVVIALTDMVVSLALWRFFARVGGKLPGIMAGLRITYTLSLCAGIMYMFLAAGSSDPLNLISRFERIWSLGLILFGAHLILLGWLCFRSGFVPGIWSLLLVISGSSYSIIHGLKNLGPAFAQVSAVLGTVLAAPMTLAELGLAAWLLVLTFHARKDFCIPQSQVRSG